MKERHDTVVIGGGQAGLAMSYHLRAQCREHVVLERHGVAERWRSDRWDSLHFQFPNWALTLPGYPYQGGEPDGFAHRQDVQDFIKDYARVVETPLRCATEAISMDRDPESGRFLIASHDAIFEASRVVMATGPFQRPTMPASSTLLPANILQLPASQYLNPEQLPAGAVLVVGAGSSGCQIAEELYRRGRTVFFSVSRHRRVPRRYRGRDSLAWLVDMGRFDTTVDSLPGRKIPPPLIVTGVDGGHDIDVRQFAADGVILLGRFIGVEHGRPAFASDLEDSLTYADQACVDVTRAMDEYISANGIRAPDPDGVPRSTALPSDGRATSSLDMKAAGINSVIWCTGYKFDFDWVHLPVFDGSGVPMQQRGVTSCPGAYFLGLHWMHKFKSGTFLGVGEDAAFIAEHMQAAT